MKNNNRNTTAYVTGLAGEFHAMELLLRKGHHPALTLGNAKSIDIVTYSPSGNRYDISVKSSRGGGKWPIGSRDYSASPYHEKLVFMFLLYKKFFDIDTTPEVWIIPAAEVEKIKRPWHSPTYGIFWSGEPKELLIPFKDAWEHLA